VRYTVLILVYDFESEDPLLSEEAETCTVSSRSPDQYSLALPSRTLSLPHDKRWFIDFENQRCSMCARFGCFEIRGIKRWFSVSHDPESSKRAYCHIDFDEHAPITRILGAEAISDFTITVWEESE
jgi:hypothetical protein